MDVSHAGDSGQQGDGYAAREKCSFGVASGMPLGKGASDYIGWVWITPIKKVLQKEPTSCSTGFKIGC